MLYLIAFSNVKNKQVFAKQKNGTLQKQGEKVQKKFISRVEENKTTYNLQFANLILI